MNAWYQRTYPTGIKIVIPFRYRYLVGITRLENLCICRWLIGSIPSYSQFDTKETLTRLEDSWMKPRWYLKKSDTNPTPVESLPRTLYWNSHIDKVSTILCVCQSIYIDIRHSKSSVTEHWLYWHCSLFVSGTLFTEKSVITLPQSTISTIPVSNSDRGGGNNWIQMRWCWNMGFIQILLSLQSLHVGYEPSN